MDKIIPLRIDEAIVTRLDILVARGIFRNRNEALRQGTRDMIEKFQNNMHERRMVASKIIANYLVTKYSHLVSRVLLFGSVAKHEDAEWSDVDLLILTRKRLGYIIEREITFDIYDLLEGTELVMSPHFQAESTFLERSRVPNTIEAIIMKEGLVLADNMPNKQNVHGKRKVDE
ncbi:MAG: nucleotidyltransferase domain-containing protein [Candidatus Sigynarchaeota archaeon]